MDPDVRIASQGRGIPILVAGTDSFFPGVNSHNKGKLLPCPSATMGGSPLASTDHWAAVSPGQPGKCKVEAMGIGQHGEEETEEGGAHDESG